MGRATSGTAPTTLLNLPPGPAQVTIASTTPGTSTTFIGLGTAASTATGFPVLSGAAPIVVSGYPSDGGGPLSMICASGSASIAFIVSTPSGGTGL